MPASSASRGQLCRCHVIIRQQFRQAGSDRGRRAPETPGEVCDRLSLSVHGQQRRVVFLGPFFIRAGVSLLHRGAAVVIGKGRKRLPRSDSIRGIAFMPVDHFQERGAVTRKLGFADAGKGGKL